MLKEEFERWREAIRSAETKKAPSLELLRHHHWGCGFGVWFEALKNRLTV